MARLPAGWLVFAVQCFTRYRDWTFEFAASLLCVMCVLCASGCGGMSVQELQSGYVRCADALELRTREMVALRDEIITVWEFAIQHKRAESMQQAVKFLHAKDPQGRIKN